MKGKQELVPLQEQEVVIVTDTKNIYLEHPNFIRNEMHEQLVEVYSFYRGEPAPVGPIYLQQYLKLRLKIIIE